MDKKLIMRIAAIVAMLLGADVAYENRDIFSSDGEDIVVTQQGETQVPESRPLPLPEKPADKPTAQPTAPKTVSKPISKPAAQPAAKPVEKKTRCIFASFKDRQWVTGEGRVKKILPDDTVPPCHQRFLLVDPTGDTLLIAHNIDNWPRLSNISVGATVEFKGEFIDTEQGGLVHWTHPDPAHRKPGGWLKLK